jgi:hypothetical protein
VCAIKRRADELGKNGKKKKVREERKAKTLKQGEGKENPRRKGRNAK